MLRVQQATGPPDGWNVMVDGELAWVQEHLRRTGQPVFPPQAVATLRLLPPMHQVLCVARLREASRLDPGQRASTAASWPSSACTKQGRCLTTRTRRPRHTLVELTSAQLLQSVQPQAAQLLPSQHLHRGLAHGRRLVRASSNPPAAGHESRWWQGRQHICLSTAIASRVRHVFMCLCVRHVRHVRHVSMCACMCALACMENAMVRGLRAFSPGQLRTQCFVSICCITHAAEDHRPTIAPYADDVELAHFV